MSKTLGIFVALLAVCVIKGASQSTPVANLKAFVGARLINGNGSPVLENAVLIVRDGKVEAVGSAGTRPPAGAQIINLTGKFIIPGLISTRRSTTNSSRS
jgi:imidazolonepropionase-like amidohydrolase